jgi:hypothetical protein
VIDPVIAAILGDCIAIIDDHIPSLTDEDEELIFDRAVPRWYEDKDAANLALRTCHCGLRIDGFYEYVDHLKAVLRKELS